MYTANEVAEFRAYVAAHSGDWSWGTVEHIAPPLGANKAHPYRASVVYIPNDRLYSYFMIQAYGNAPDTARAAVDSLVQMIQPEAKIYERLELRRSFVTTN